MLNLILAAALCSPITQPFTGTLCAPNDGKKHAAMILLGGSEGGDSMSPVAKIFAERGYVSASIAYFKAPNTPATLVDVPVETIKHGIDALAARADVNAERIGIMGLSKGGELSLLAASVYPQIHAVVAIVPSPYAYMGLGEYGRATGCSWTVAGSVLPCIPTAPDGPAIVAKQVQSGEAIRLEPFYEAARTNDPVVTEKAQFALERIDAPVLCLAAGDDQIWNSSIQCAQTIEYLHAHRHPYADRSVVYPHAGHLFVLAAGGPQYAMNSMKAGPATLAFGGTPDIDAAAAASAYATIWSYLDAALGVHAPS